MLLTLLLSVASIAQPAVASPPPTFTMATCDNASTRRAFLDADPDRLAVMNLVKERATAQEVRMILLLDRLGERAKISEKEKSALVMRMVDAPAFKAAFEDGMALATRMLKGLGSVMESKDDTRNCRALVGMMSLLPAIEANADRQWTAMRGVLESEARRLGVSLAD